MAEVKNKNKGKKICNKEGWKKDYGGVVVLREMANKVAALLAMCLAVMATVQLPSGAAAEEDAFTTSFRGCQDECQNSGGSNTKCEMKLCDMHQLLGQLYER